MLITAAAAMLLALQTPAPAPVAPPPTAAGVDAAVGARSLALTKALVAETKRYAAGVEAYRRKTSDAGLCKVAADADALAAALQTPLLDRRTALWDTPALDTFIADTAALSKALTGVYLAYGAEGIHAYRDDGEMAELAPAGPAREFFKQLGPFARSGDFPSWMRQVTDIQGCLDLPAATRILVDARPFFARAPACLRERFRPLLMAELSRMASWSWVCGERTEALAQVEPLSAALTAWPELGGPDAAALLRKKLGSPDARFGEHNVP